MQLMSSRFPVHPLAFSLSLARLLASLAQHNEIVRDKPHSALFQLAAHANPHHDRRESPSASVKKI